MNVTHDAELSALAVTFLRARPLTLSICSTTSGSNFSLRSFRKQFYDDPLAIDLASLNISDVRDVECATSLAMILVGYL